MSQTINSKKNQQSDKTKSKVEKVHKLEFYRIGEMHVQVKVSKQMLFEIKVNPDGTCNFSVTNIEFSKPVMGKKTSFKDIMIRFHVLKKNQKGR